MKILQLSCLTLFFGFAAACRSNPQQVAGEVAPSPAQFSMEVHSLKNEYATWIQEAGSSSPEEKMFGWKQTVVNPNKAIFDAILENGRKQIEPEFRNFLDKDITFHQAILGSFPESERQAKSITAAVVPKLPGLPPLSVLIVPGLPVDGKAWSVSGRPTIFLSAASVMDFPAFMTRFIIAHETFHQWHFALARDLLKRDFPRDLNLRSPGDIILLMWFEGLANQFAAQDLGVDAENKVPPLKRCLGREKQVAQEILHVLENKSVTPAQLEAHASEWFERKQPLIGYCAGAQVTKEALKGSTFEQLVKMSQSEIETIVKRNLARDAAN